MERTLKIKKIESKFSFANGTMKKTKEEVTKIIPNPEYLKELQDKAKTGWVELTEGSEKQIAWAKSLREKFINELVVKIEENEENFASGFINGTEELVHLEEFIYRVKKENSALYFIHYRSFGSPVMVAYDHFIKSELKEGKNENKKSN